MPAHAGCSKGEILGEAARGSAPWSRLRVALSTLAVAICMAGPSHAPVRAHPPTVLSGAAEKVVADEVEAFRKTLAQAVTRKDAAALKRMYAEGFVHTDERGRSEGRDARIAAATAGVPLIEGMPARDVVIRIPGGWTAIATGVSTWQAGSEKRAADLRWTAVYVRIDDGFQLAASQATRATRVPPRALRQ